MADLSIPQRFKRARSFVGETQKEFAKRFGVDQSTIAKWETSRQDPRPQAFDILADIEADMVDADREHENVTGRREGLFTFVPIVGHIGAGAAIYPLEADTASRSIGWTKAPRGIGAVESFIVRGDSMWPAYRDGDVLFVENRISEFPLISGKEYIVDLADGRRLLKMIEPGTAGTYNLVSHNAPPENNVTIMQAHRVRFVRKA